jgi:hypothetical protein
VSEEGEVFVANLLDIEQATVRANIGLLKVIDPVDNCRACCSGYSVVIRLSDAAKSSNISLDEVMLRKI